MVSSPWLVQNNAARSGVRMEAFNGRISPAALGAALSEPPCLSVGVCLAAIMAAVAGRDQAAHLRSAGAQGSLGAEFGG